MELMVRLWNRSYYRSSNIIVELHINKSFIECGYKTYGAKGLWYLFISGHKILRGFPSQFFVEITSQEERVLKMIAQTGFWRKRGFWRTVVELKRDRTKVLKELEEKLPICVLSSKLSIDKKC